MNEQVWQAKVKFEGKGTAEGMHRTRTGAIRQVQAFLDEKDVAADAASMFGVGDDGLCVLGWGNTPKLGSRVEMWVRPFQLED